jgi:hypothetical protein
MACTDAQVVHRRAQRVVPNGSPNRTSGARDLPLQTKGKPVRFESCRGHYLTSGNVTACDIRAPRLQLCDDAMRRRSAWSASAPRSSPGRPLPRLHPRRGAECVRRECRIFTTFRTRILGSPPASDQPRGGQGQKARPHRTPRGRRAVTATSGRGPTHPRRRRRRCRRRPPPGRPRWHRSPRILPSTGSNSRRVARNEERG